MSAGKLAFEMSLLLPLKVILAKAFNKMPTQIIPTMANNSTYFTLKITEQDFEVLFHKAGTESR